MRALEWLARVTFCHRRNACRVSAAVEAGAPFGHAQHKLKIQLPPSERVSMFTARRQNHELSGFQRPLYLVAISAVLSCLAACGWVGPPPRRQWGRGAARF